MLLLGKVVTSIVLLQIGHERSDLGTLRQDAVRETPEDFLRLERLPVSTSKQLIKTHQRFTF